MYKHCIKLERVDFSFWMAIFGYALKSTVDAIKINNT